MTRFLIIGLSVFALAGSVVGGGLAATIHGPRLAANEKLYNSSTVELTMTFQSHYRHVTPGAKVTVTNCAGWHEGPLKVIDSPGFLPDGQDLDISRGKAVWSIGKMPAAPASPQLDLLISLPKGGAGPLYCTHVQMNDNLTGKSFGFSMKLRLTATAASTA